MINIRVRGIEGKLNDMKVQRQHACGERLYTVVIDLERAYDKAELFDVSLSEIVFFTQTQ